MKICARRPSFTLLTATVIATITHFAMGAPAANDSTAATLAKLERDQVDWKVRIRALAGAARTSSESVPMLVDAIQYGAAAQREFAAQALGLILDPVTRCTLQKATKDEHRGVRGYAQRALRTLGPVNTKPLSHAESVRATTRNYDLRRIDSARVGATAPDFELLSALGKPIRLRQFRGQTVILEFNGAYD